MVFMGRRAGYIHLKELKSRCWSRSVASCEDLPATSPRNKQQSAESFRGKNEESVNLLCTDENEGEDCLAANVEMNKPEDQDKVLLHLVNMNMPVRPGILVQRQSKEVTAPHLGENIEFEEDKNRQIFESANVRETNYKGGIVERTPMRATLTPSVIESQKRPLKGVTFSKEVIVVDLGNEYTRPRSYAREHKERK
ncbi:uncharacterized protein C2orf74 homolog isoform X2 [Microtus ochrogaster]|uniref:Uncharacterized protein C2orf74 homolog isoform X2 n=1 Tax=Microtus ochrogaster TaxID=79684 RepID=A0ABM1AVA8_MICOH|nr:uncharacterized protein C2orf74 homolog isoform X2 [Microtus ochrogaster]